MTSFDIKRPWHRWGLFLVGTVVVCFVLGAMLYRSLPALVPEERLRAALEAQAATWTGGELRLAGAADLSLVGGPHVTISDATFTGIRGGDSWTLDVATLRASLKSLPLLRGRIEIEQLVLDRPQFRLGRAHGPDRKSLTAAAPPAQGGGTPIGEVILTDASIATGGDASGSTKIDGLDLRMLAVPETTELRLTGALDAGPRRIEFEGWLEDRAAAFSERGSPGRLVFHDGDAPGSTGTPPAPPPDKPATAKADGEWTSAVRRIAARIGLPAYGPVSLEGHFALTRRSVDITRAALSVNGTLVEGDLAIGLDGGEPSLEQIDRMIRDVREPLQSAAARISSGQWREADIPLAWLAPFDIALDLRASDGLVRSAELDTLRLRLDSHEGRSRMAILVAGDPGRLETDIDLDHEPGSGVTHIAVAGAIEGVDMLRATRAYYSRLPPPLVGMPRLPEGSLEGAFDISAKGATLGALATGIDGVVVARMREGSFPGADLILTLEGLADGREFMSEEGGPLIPAAGRTSFENVEARVQFVRDAARLDMLRISSDRYVIDMNGEVDLRTGGMQADGQAILLADDRQGSGGDPLVDLPFGFGGTFAAPVVAVGVPRTSASADTDAMQAGEREAE